MSANKNARTMKKMKLDLMNSVVELLGKDIVGSIVTGLAGGLVALKFEEEKLTVTRAFLVLVSGVFGSVYLGNAFCEWMELTEKIADGVKFMIALASMRLFEAIINIANRIKVNPFVVLEILFRRTILKKKDENENK